MLSALVLLLSALAETPAFVFEGTEMFPAPSTDATPTRLPQCANLMALGPADTTSDQPMIQVRTTDNQEGFVRPGEIAQLAIDGGEMRYYLTGHRQDGDRSSVLIVMTDAHGTLVSQLPGPTSSGERLLPISGVEWPGVDELIVLEAYRSSCPGGSQQVVMARVGEYLLPVVTVASYGEAGWHNSTELYRPVRDGDGILRYRHILQDTYLKDPIVTPQPGMLIAAESVEELYSDQMGRPYTLHTTSQRVIEWSIAVED